MEAPRGTLTHHYTTDERGVLKKVNLIVGTTNNYAPISMSIKRVAEKLITGGKAVEEGLLNRIEMAFRLYDPCLSCSTHALGEMPLLVRVENPDGSVTAETMRFSVIGHCGIRTARRVSGFTTPGMGATSGK